MKSKKLAGILTTVALTAVMLSSCGSSPKSLTKSLVGDWTSEYGESLSFYEDGTFDNNGTFLVMDDKRLKLTERRTLASDDVDVYEYVEFNDKDSDDSETWTINGNILYLGRTEYTKD